MRSMKVFEITVIFGLMGFLIGFSLWLVPLGLLYIINVRIALKKESKKQSQRQLLEKLSEFATLLQQGYSPMFAYDKIDNFAYPEFMLHPRDEIFQWEIFEKQLHLYEKMVLLEEEVQGEMMVVRLRMRIMKLMPLSLLLFLRHFLPGTNQIRLNVLAVFFFLINHWVSEMLLEKL